MPQPPFRAGHRVLLAVVALLIVALSAGCGGESEPTLADGTPPPTECPEATPTPATTLEPTATESSTATAQPSATEAATATMAPTTGPTEPEACATATPTATTEPTATTVPSPTPVPTPIIRSSINGLPIGQPSTTRIMTIKVDNHPNARPQTGIQHADMTIEIWVEGVTRFLSVWQDSDTDVVGPIRSMRPTDFSIQNSWHSLFVNSGGQGWVAAIGRRSNVQFFVEPRGTFRSSDRRAPHNLYGNTEALRELNSRGDYDEPLAPFWNFAPIPDAAETATEIVTSWSNGFYSSWEWNGETYEKSTKGAPHTYFDEDGKQQQVTADTLIVLEMAIYSQSGGGSSVPVTETTGSGVAWVFADGRMVKGTWARDTDEEWFVLTGEDGTQLPVPPGRPWLILAKRGGVAVD